MKSNGAKIILLLSLLFIQNCSNSSDPAAWSEDKINKWFDSGEYLNGWAIIPDESVSKRKFAVAYFKDKERWDKAFTFLKNTDLSSLEIKKYELDGDNLFALVSEYITRNEEDTKFESHRKYADIQFVISGSEKISVSPVTKKREVLTPYDETTDNEFMTVTESTDVIANSQKFFLFFPSDLHRPGMKAEVNEQVKKVVVKVKL